MLVCFSLEKAWMWFYEKWGKKRVFGMRHQSIKVLTLSAVMLLHYSAACVFLKARSEVTMQILSGHFFSAVSPQTSCRSGRLSRFSATHSTAASAPCRDASRMEPEAPHCRTHTSWPSGPSRFCPTSGWCTAGTPSTTRHWRAAPVSPGSSVSETGNLQRLLRSTA